MRPRPGGRHPRWGTRNALLALGPATYIEAIGPDPDREAAAVPTLFGMDRLERPRLVAWAARSFDLDGDRHAAARHGLVLGAVLPGRRETPDGRILDWRLTDPTIVLGDGLVPFLIDWKTSVHPAATAPTAGRLVALHAHHPDPDTIRARLAALSLELLVERATEPALQATIETSFGTVELT